MDLFEYEIKPGDELFDTPLQLNQFGGIVGDILITSVSKCQLQR